MKFVTYPLVVCIILTSCQNVTQINPKPKLNDPDSLKYKLAPIFSGDWVVVSYMDSIKLSKSPYKSQNELPGIVELNIRIEAPVSDSAIIGVVNIHEGTNLTLYFRQGTLQTSLPLNLKDYEKPKDYFELGYGLENNDTVLLLYHFDQTGVRVSETKYSKVTNHKEEAFQYQLNKTLFSGSYERIDSLEASGEIGLTNDGVISGLSSWDRYFVIADFVTANDSATDEICFQIQTKNQICFGYRFNGDTLRLFKKIEDENGEFKKPGDLEYVMVRKAK